MMWQTPPSKVLSRANFRVTFDGFPNAPVSFVRSVFLSDPLLIVRFNDDENSDVAMFVDKLETVRSFNVIIDLLKADGSVSRSYEFRKCSVERIDDVLNVDSHAATEPNIIQLSLLYTDWIYRSKTAD